MNCDESNPKFKSSLHLCSPPPHYSDFGWAVILSGNKCFIWCAPYHRKAQCFCSKTSAYTHMYTLNNIFPVETLRSFITTLSKRNLPNDGCIEQFFFFYEINRCLYHLVLHCLPNPVPTELEFCICSCVLSDTYSNHHLLLHSFQKILTSKIMTSASIQSSPLSL